MNPAEVELFYYKAFADLGIGHRSLSTLASKCIAMTLWFDHSRGQHQNVQKS
jgi:hypothetical protein